MQSLTDVTEKYMKMTKEAILEGSSQQENKDFINRRNGQGPKHLKFLLVFSKWGPSPINIFIVISLE